MYDLGIVGGMGPLATVVIYKKIVERTRASSDQEHMSILILNKPEIPDRTKAILEDDLSPVESLNESIEELVRLGSKNFIMACNTAHYFVQHLNIPSSIHFINMIDVALIKVQKTHPGSRVVLLATTGTVKSNIYKTSMFASNLSIIYPIEQDQVTVMDIIYKIKSGIEKETTIVKLEGLIKGLANQYHNCVFLFACTELSIHSSYFKKAYKVVDAVDALVEASIIRSGYKLSEKEELS